MRPPSVFPNLITYEIPNFLFLPQDSVMIKWIFEEWYAYVTKIFHILIQFV